MSNRADKIYEILKEAGGRLKTSEIHTRLANRENIDPKTLHYATISSTVKQDNEVRTGKGLAKRFKRYEKERGEGEDYGYISIDIYDANSSLNISQSIEKANNQVKQELKKAIKNLSWQEFECKDSGQTLWRLGAFGFAH